MFLLGGITYMQFGLTFIPSSAWHTSILVYFVSRSGMMLWWVGEGCVIRTNAILLSDGMLRKKRSKASSPPAEAPIHTMKKALLFLSGERPFQQVKRAFY